MGEKTKEELVNIPRNILKYRWEFMRRDRKYQEAYYSYMEAREKDPRSHIGCEVSVYKDISRKKLHPKDERVLLSFMYKPSTISIGFLNRRFFDEWGLLIPIDPIRVFDDKIVFENGNKIIVKLDVLNFVLSKPGMIDSQQVPVSLKTKIDLCGLERLAKSGKVSSKNVENFKKDIGAYLKDYARFKMVDNEAFRSKLGLLNKGDFGIVVGGKGIPEFAPDEIDIKIFLNYPEGIIMSKIKNIVTTLQELRKQLGLQRDHRRRFTLYDSYLKIYDLREEQKLSFPEIAKRLFPKEYKQYREAGDSVKKDALFKKLREGNYRYDEAYAKAYSTKDNPIVQRVIDRFNAAKKILEGGYNMII